MDALPPPYPSGCELLLSKKPTHSQPTRFAQIQQAFQHSSTYFTITYLYDTCGYGAIASIDIPKLTLILNEPPLIPCDALESVLSRYEKGELKCGEEDAEFMREYYGRECVKLGVEEDAKDEVDGLIGMIWAMHDQYAVPSTEIPNTCGASIIPTDSTILNPPTHTIVHPQTHPYFDQHFISLPRNSIILAVLMLDMTFAKITNAYLLRETFEKENSYSVVTVTLCITNQLG
eukprot:CCRYP_019104-RB/>CCRYP_019104-RB protein AED:0.01 eAED:0.01 QI:24/1/1/1/0/0/3/440/231